MFLTGMFADISTASGERIILPDETESILVSARFGKRDIAGDIDMGRASFDTGNRAFDVIETFSIMDMFL
jgi:hypothetical protein